MKSIWIAFAVTLAIVAWSMPSLAADGPASALGWQTSSSLQGISFKHAFSPGLAVQGVLGYTSLSIKDPTIEENGHEEELDMSLGVSAWTLGGRVLWTLKQEANLDVYAGGGASLYLISADADIIADSAEISGTALGFQGVTGVEYRFQGLENLAFSTEIGFDYTRVNNLDVETSYGDVTIKPNTSIKSFFLGGGIHYYF
jgi:hypothetical protein